MIRTLRSFNVVRRRSIVSGQSGHRRSFRPLPSSRNAPRTIPDPGSELRDPRPGIRNPSNMLVGYHTDWASAFPFEQLGLPDNYARPLPSVMIFGFDSDPDFRRRTGERVHEGVEMAQAELRAEAAEQGVSTDAYRARLQKRFRRRLEQLQEVHPASNAGLGSAFTASTSTRPDDPRR